MAAAPMGISHQETQMASTRPVAAAAAKEIAAAVKTCWGVAAFEATRRGGPVLFWSVPRMPSL